MSSLANSKLVISEVKICDVEIQKISSRRRMMSIDIAFESNEFEISAIDNFAKNFAEECWHCVSKKKFSTESVQSTSNWRRKVRLLN